MKHHRVVRYDYLPSVSAKAELTKEGYLKVECRATRVGVLKYRKADGSVFRELRSLDQVFEEESMRSLAMIPVTDEHPPGLLDSTTAPDYSIGSTGEVISIDEQKYLKTMVVITDAEAIKRAGDGSQVEVSPGYTCELEMTAGIFDGEPYDAIQKNIRYNHLAIVKRGRSGPEVRLRLDSDDAASTDLNQTPERKTMKIKFGKDEFDVDDKLGQAVERHQAEARKASEEMDDKIKEAVTTATSEYKGMADKHDALKKKLKDALEDKEDSDKEKEKAEAKADALDSELRKLKKTRTDALEGDKFNERVNARIKLMSVAKAAGVEKFDSLSDMEIKKAVIKLDDEEIDLSKKSDDYVEARFDVAVKSIENADELALSLGSTVTVRETEEKFDSESARQRMIERQRKQWNPDTDTNGGKK